MLVPQQLLHHGPVGKRWSSREKMIESATQAVNVPTNVCLAGVNRLLGRNIVWRSHERTLLSQSARLFLAFLIMDDSRKPHVQNLDRIRGLGEQQVVRFEIPMDQPTVEGMLQ